MKLVDYILYDTIKKKQFKSEIDNFKVKLMMMSFLLDLEEGENILECQI